MTHFYEVHTTWSGGLSGQGSLKSEGLEAPFSVPHEFNGKGTGTNPEELLALTASSCYAITLCTLLGFQGIAVKECSIRSAIEVYFDKGLLLKKIIHFPRLIASNGTVEKITEAVLRAKAVCFFSKALNKDVAVEVKPEIIVEAF